MQSIEKILHKNANINSPKSREDYDYTTLYVKCIEQCYERSEFNQQPRP